MARRILAVAISLLLSISVLAQRRQMEDVGLTVFADPGFRGESATFREDISNIQSVGLNDKISSLRVARGETWEVCEHANYAGRCKVFSGSESDLRTVGWNDLISSARRIRDNGRGGNGRVGNGRGRGGSSHGDLVLFADLRYTGDRRVFNAEVSNLQFVDFNDKARSLRIEGPGSWEICADANFQNCVVVNRDTADLARVGMSRRISSFRPVSR